MSRMLNSTRVYLLVLFALSPAVASQAATIPGAPEIWLKDAATTFDGTTWLDSSGNGHHATAVGLRAAGTNATEYPAMTYSAGTASTQFGVSGLAFDGDVDDLMRAGDTFATESDVTVFAVYSTSIADGSTRPVGIGSVSALGGNQSVNQPLFNLATEGSLTYDNGNNQGLNANLLDELLVRASRLDSAEVTDWVNGVVNIGPTTTASGGVIPSALGLGADAFYLGDVRAGFTPTGSNGTTSFADLFISQVAVYRSALSDQEILDISTFLQNNPDGVAVIPEPRSIALGLVAAAGVCLLLRRRRHR